MLIVVTSPTYNLQMMPEKSVSFVNSNQVALKTELVYQHTFLLPHLQQ